MGGEKNVHRNLYNEEFHYAGLDIPEMACMCVYLCVCMRVYIYIISEYRTACFIDRDKIRLHLPPASFPAASVSGSCMNHDAPVSSPWDRFFVSSTFGIVFGDVSGIVRVSARELADRLACGRSEQTNEVARERSASSSEDRTMRNDE